MVKDKRTGGEEKVKEERRERAWSILGLGGKDLGNGSGDREGNGDGEWTLMINEVVVGPALVVGAAMGTAGVLFVMQYFAVGRGSARYRGQPYSNGGKWDNVQKWVATALTGSLSSAGSCWMDKPA